MNTGHSRYRKEIDGLRALAVFSVLFNHLNYSFLPSGFLGVDIFFVISGYVILLSIVGQSNISAKDFLVSFYTRRLRRIMPALFVCVLLNSIIICIFNPLPQLSLRTGISSLFGLSNIYIYKQSAEYFTSSSELNVFTQTWSLGVEEQFYLIFPALFTLIVLGKKSDKRKTMIMILVLLTVLSLVIFLYYSKYSFSYSYFLLPARFWELSIGVILGLIHSYSNSLPTNSKYSSYLFLIGLLISLSMPLDLRIISTMLAVAMTVGLIHTLSPSNKILFRLFSNKISVYLGQISYSLYLWHWAVISVSRWTIGIHGWTVPIQILLSIILATASYQLIEKPFRFHFIFRARFTFIITLLISIIIAGICLILEKKGKQTLFSGTFYEQRHEIIGTSINRENAFRSPKQLSGIWNADSCYVAPKNDAINIFSLGDSHNEHLVQLYNKLRERIGIGVGMYSDIPFPVFNAYSAGHNRTSWTERKNHMLTAYHAFEKKFQKGDILVLSSRLEYYWSNEYLQLLDIKRNSLISFFDSAWSPISRQEHFERWLQDVAKLADSLQQFQVKVILISPLPIFSGVSDPYPAEACSSQWFRPSLSSSCPINYTVSANKLINHISPIRDKLIKLQKQHSNLYVLDFLNFFYDKKNDVFIAGKNENSYYSDANHLSNFGSALLSKKFEDFIKVKGILLHRNIN